MNDPLLSGLRSNGLVLFPALHAALPILLDAYLRAAEVQHPPWEFAVEIHEMRAAGVAASTMRWLVCQGYAEHAQETTEPGDTNRQFLPATSLLFTERTNFLLTPAGAALARQHCALDGFAGRLPNAPVPPAGPEAPAATSTPRWSSELRELRYRGLRVKRYRVPAPNQELILATFERQGWRPRIEDPLPQRTEIDPGRRLRDTVNSLNRNQHAPLLRFRADGTGNGFCWEPRQAEPTS